MWIFSRKPKTPRTPDEQAVHSFGIWHFMLIAFIVTWMLGAYIILEQKSEHIIDNPPVIVLDEAGQINMMSNMFTLGTNRQLFPPVGAATNDSPKFEVRQKYNYGDIVVVKYFYIEAIVIEKYSVGDKYIILYKDHNHQLQTISLPRTMLMAPAEGVLSPVSMLVD